MFSRRIYQAIDKAILQTVQGLNPDEYTVLNFYAEIDNAERLNENRRMLEVAAIMTEMYFREIGMPEDFVIQFIHNVQRSIQDISDNTFYLLGGERMVVLKTLKRIFNKTKIRKAYYEKQWSPFSNDYISKYRYKQEHFWISRNEDFVWIEDYKESLLKGSDDGCNQYNENPCLMIREERLRELFTEEIQTLLKQGQISSLIADKVSINLLRILREMQIIYKQCRSDSKWGRPAVNYPVYDHASIWRHHEVNCWVSFEPVIQLNTWHPCIETLKDKMDNETQQVVLIEGDGWRIEEDRDEIYRVRKAFINNKSLYRE